MPDIRGILLPVYFVADESASMSTYIGDLNAGLRSLHAALLAEPMTAAKVRFTIAGFSDDVITRLQLSDLRHESGLPELFTRANTNYTEVFVHLSSAIAADIDSLKKDGYQVHRPAVFFLSDGQPNVGGDWKAPHRILTDRAITPAAPNVVACGIGQADANTILEVATDEKFAFVSINGADVGASIAKFCAALTQSIVQSGRSVGSGKPELVVDQPEGFRLAIDVV